MTLPARRKILNSSPGFTLIELMVVISIIAVLATVGIISYSSVQKSSRISKRIQDLKAISTAVELYHNLHGSYPVTSGWFGECAAWGGKASDQVIPGLVPEDMPSLPHDPQMNASANTNCYLYISNGADYKLLDYNVPEMNVNDLKAQPSLWDPSEPNNPLNTTDSCPFKDGNRRFAIYTSGAACW